MKPLSPISRRISLAQSPTTGQILTIVGQIISIIGAALAQKDAPADTTA